MPFEWLYWFIFRIYLWLLFENYLILSVLFCGYPLHDIRFMMPLYLNIVLCIPIVRSLTLIIKWRSIGVICDLDPEPWTIWSKGTLITETIVCLVIPMPIKNRFWYIYCGFCSYMDGSKEKPGCLGCCCSHSCTGRYVCSLYSLCMLLPHSKPHSKLKKTKQKRRKRILTKVQKL